MGACEAAIAAEKADAPVPLAAFLQPVTEKCQTFGGDQGAALGDQRHIAVGRCVDRAGGLARAPALAVDGERRASVAVGIPTFNRPADCVKALRALASDPLVMDVVDAVIIPDQGTRKVRDEPDFAEAAAPFGDRLVIHDQHTAVDTHAGVLSNYGALAWALPVDRCPLPVGRCPLPVARWERRRPRRLAWRRPAPPLGWAGEAWHDARGSRRRSLRTPAEVRASGFC